MTSLSTDSPPARDPDQTGSNRRRGRPSTRKKIERMVAEGTKNYPAYLKLIYTGDSEQSEEDESNTDGKGELADLSVGRSTGDGQVSVESVVSPESVKLLDPGKEKATTPIGGDEGVKEEEGKLRRQRSGAEPANLDEVRISDDDRQSEELERVESQQSIEEKWKLELFQLQDDIVSLKAMLNGKLQVAAELKQRLGISPMAELKHDLKHSLQSLKESGTIVKTNALLRSLGAYASRKMGSIRNSVVFKSVEERVGKVKSTSMGHLRSKLHRKLPASKSDSHMGELQTTGIHLSVAINSIEDQTETDTLTNTKSNNQNVCVD